MMIGLLMLLVLMTCCGWSLAARNSVRTEAELVPVRVRVASKRRS